MQRGLSVVGGFFLRAILWLVPSLALWYWAREWVVQPVAWLVERVMLLLFPGWVYGTEMEGTVIALLTTIPVPQRGGMVAELAPEANVLTYCYGLPMLLALLLASRSKGLWWKFPLGALVIWMFQAWGVVFDLLVHVGVMASSFSAPITGFTRVHADVFAVGYQLGTLLLPTLVPMLLWLRFERRFLGMVMFDAALSGATRRR